MAQAQQASQAELNKFVQIVDEFKLKYARLKTPDMRSDVYATGNAQLINDYESTLSKAKLLDNSINSLVGAWAKFKSTYRNITGITSTWIGDAIDNIREWFDRDKGVGSYMPLGAIQLPGAVAITAIISTAAILIAAMNRIFIAVEASKLQRENPGMSRDVALAQAKQKLPSPWPKGLGLGTLALGGLALWAIFGRRS